MLRSDSSMDDCNGLDCAEDHVQDGSDSSMDDCNVKARFSSSAVSISSDSSMDDCNTFALPPDFMILYVQIPLWTIVT